MMVLNEMMVGQNIHLLSYVKCIFGEHLFFFFPGLEQAIQHHTITNMFYAHNILSYGFFEAGHLDPNCAFDFIAW